MPFYAGTNHILQPNPILCIPDFRQSTNTQISVKAQPHADLLSSSFRFRAFLQFILHPNRLSTGLQGTSACAMALICVHRAPRTPPDSTPGHIRSRDGINLCPSSDPNPSRQHSRAYPLARWFAGGRIPSRNLRSRIRGVLQKSQALHLIKIRAGVCASHYALV